MIGQTISHYRVSGPVGIQAEVDESRSRTFRILRPRKRHPPRHWKSIVYANEEEGADNLWEQPLDGSKGKQFTSFKSEHIWDFHWSPDGKQLAIVRGHTDSDIVLIRDTRQ